MMDCPDCKGLGKENCWRCKGRGEVPEEVPDVNGTRICPDCKGEGKKRVEKGIYAFLEDCPTCEGKGKVEECPCEQCQAGVPEVRPVNGTRIYIAGPYLPKNCELHNVPRQAQRNVDRFIEAFHQLKKKGMIPYVPTLSHYLHIHPSCPEDYGDWWYNYDMTFIENWAEAIYMLKGWENSKGATMEFKKAEELGLKIYYEEDDIWKSMCDDFGNYDKDNVGCMECKTKEKDLFCACITQRGRTWWNKQKEEHDGD